MLVLQSFSESDKSVSNFLQKIDHATKLGKKFKNYQDEKICKREFSQCSFDSKEINDYLRPRMFYIIELIRSMNR